MLTQQQVRDLFNYNPLTGELTWKVRPSNRVRVGSTVGTIEKAGYRSVSINRKFYKAHKIIWLYVYGVWPTNDIDHEDLNKDNNRLVNLREATRSQNKANCPKRANNTSGFKGVYAVKKTGQWMAQITVNYNKIYLGTYETPADAHAAYVVAAQKHFGTFARA